MVSPPCVTTLTINRREHVLPLERVVPGVAWIRRANWATVRLNKIEPQWFVLEVLDPLAPGPYAFCFEQTVVEFAVPEA